MSEHDTIRRALDTAGLAAAVDHMQSMSGGCIHRVLEVRLRDGSRCVAKIAGASVVGVFEQEAVGLRALAATGTVLVPEPLVVTADDCHAVLLMSRIESAPATATAWTRFGRELSLLHRFDSGSRYGFGMDNHLGSTPQPNQWNDDWVAFNAESRLGHQLRLAGKADLLEVDECNRVQRLIDRLDSFIPRRPFPALLHGDLWSGNALPAAGGRIAVIDPACSIGDGWADIAMMRLFGGFPAACLKAYAAAIDDLDGVETRIKVYQLYHVLNHVNIFGRGYAAQAMSVLRSLGV